MNPRGGVMNPRGGVMDAYRISGLLFALDPLDKGRTCGWDYDAEGWALATCRDASELQGCLDEWDMLGMYPILSRLMGMT